MFCRTMTGTAAAGVLGLVTALVPATGASAFGVSATFPDGTSYEVNERAKMVVVETVALRHTTDISDTGEHTWRKVRDNGKRSVWKALVENPGDHAVSVTVTRTKDGAQFTTGADYTVTASPDPEPEPEPQPEPGRADLPYGADSFFQSTVEGAPVNGARTQEFRSFMATHPEQKATPYPKINVNPDWAMSYHVGKATDPIWKLAGGNTSDTRLAITRTQGFHMADSVADTFPTGDQDRPGVMVDSVFGYTVQFADAVVNRATRTITVSNAGIMWHSSNGLDYRNPHSDDNRNFTSRGRILDAMVIRRDLLDKAIANDTGLGHVLHLFFVETNTADGVVHPMVGAEGDKSGFGAEGERIRIKPSVDLQARGLTGAALAIARTLQDNGAYIGDNSGSGTQLKASQPHNYVGTNISTDALEGHITWNDFEVIETGWQ